MDPAWVEMVTPETMLMLAHSRAYVDQLRTRVDEAGSSVECLTAIDDGSEDHDLEGMAAGDRGMDIRSTYLAVRSLHKTKLDFEKGGRTRFGGLG